MTEIKMEQATFGAGCFWGVESFFREVPGVIDAVAGYAGGHTQNPAYRDVCSDRTGHVTATLCNSGRVGIPVVNSTDPSRRSYVHNFEPITVSAIWSFPAISTKRAPSRASCEATAVNS